MTDPADDTSTAANPLVGGPRGRVTVRLKDGKVLSGVYPALLALARVEEARRHGDCASASIEWL